jgi:hypothetical protein
VLRNLEMYSGPPARSKLRGMKIHLYEDNQAVCYILREMTSRRVAERVMRRIMIVCIYDKSGEKSGRRKSEPRESQNHANPRYPEGGRRRVKVPAPYPHASQTPPPSSPRKPRVGDERGSWTS